MRLFTIRCQLSFIIISLHIQSLLLYLVASSVASPVSSTVSVRIVECWHLVSALVLFLLSELLALAITLEVFWWWKLRSVLCESSFLIFHFSAFYIFVPVFNSFPSVSHRLIVVSLSVIFYLVRIQPLLSISLLWNSFRAVWISFINHVSVVVPDFIMTLNRLSESVNSAEGTFLFIA